MAIDANILLQGIVPDAVGSAQRGFTLGQQLKNAPQLNKLLDLQTQQAQQGVNQGQFENQQQESLVIANTIGDLTRDQLTPENWPTVISGLERQGVQVQDQNRAFSPQAANTLFSVAQAGKQAARQARGGQSGFQTNAPIITEKPKLDANGQPMLGADNKPIMQKFFTSLQSDRASGEQRVSNIPVSGEILDRQGLNVGDRVSEVKQTTLAKEIAKGDVEKDVKPEVVRLEAQAREQQKASTGAFKQAKSIDSQIRSLDKAIGALNEGANTGVIASKFPSFTAATVKLEEAAKELGIEVINSATFGALSEKELQLALSKGIPENLGEDDLLPYLKEKKTAMKRVQSELNAMGKFLSKKGNTFDKWLNKQDELRAQQARISGGIQEGQTATNAQGQKIIFRGGQWQAQ